MSPAEIVQAQFDAYKARDADTLAACYAEDAIIAEYNGAVLQRGHAEIRERFARTFAEYPSTRGTGEPGNRAWPEGRIVVGNTVVDREVGYREPGGERFEIVAIYTIRDGLIARLDMAR